MTQITEIRYSKSSIEQGTNDTQWTHVQQYIITSAEAKSLSTDKINIGLRVWKINRRIHNQQATGCCLGMHLLLDEVSVRELNEGNSRSLLVTYRTCNIGPTVADKKGEEDKRGRKQSMSTESTCT